METGVLLLILGLCLSTRLHAEEECKEGYTRDNIGTCLDEDECESLPPICGENGTCFNTPGSYYCNCKTGFRSSKENFTAEDSKCQDINECQKKIHTCNDSQICVNTIGSFKCVCLKGFRERSDHRGCEEINECRENTHTCDPSQTCENRIGSFKCVCSVGYRERSDRQACEDVDECVENPPDCGSSSICTNTPGSYTCTCPEGFRNRGNNLTAPCEDVDECVENPPDCGSSSICTNTPGSYTCTCPEGFRNRGNNLTAPCEDVDECVETPPDCGPRGTCTNTRGSYTCTCPEGFRNRGNDLTAPCEDKDECGTGSGTCGSDSEGKCTNTEGSYTCECLPGHSNYGNRQGKCTKLSCDGYQMTSNDQAVGGLAHLWKKMRQNCEGLTNGTGEPGHGAGNGMLEDMLSGTDDFMSSGQSVGDSNQVTGLLTMMEKAMMLIGPQLKQNRTKMESNHIEVEIAVKRGETPPTGPVLLKTANAAFKTSWETAAGNSGTYPGFTVAALVSYKSLDSTPASSFEALKKEMEAERRKEQEEQKELVSLQIISNVVTACISNPHPHHLDQRVNFTFKHHQELNESARLNYTCVFWDRDSWSRRGCESSSTSTHTTCSCDHLSSFAVLMALYDIKHTFELKLITWIGLAVSLACLLVCILTFGLCRSIKGTRTTIHLHLSLCLFLADLIFLCGINRAQKAGCGLVAGLLHYFFLAAFSWMLLEGVQLYRMVVLVFHTSLRPAYMLAAGYGAPLAIVIVSAIAYPQGYGTNQHCWLSLDRGFIWAFFGPVCVIIFLNAFFFLITLWKLAEKLSSLNPDLSNLQKIKGFTVAAVAQLCVLGGMWMFGCFMFQSVVMVYLFTILNSLQGALIFIMHCLMSKPVREEYAKFLQGIWTPGKGSYTDYTSNPSSNSQQPLKTSHSTGQSQL